MLTKNVMKCRGHLQALAVQNDLAQAGIYTKLSNSVSAGPGRNNRVTK